MISLHLMRKNLGRKKMRTTLTVLSIIVAFVLLTLLLALSRAFSMGVEMAGADRLITMHRVSFIQPLPLSYLNRVESIEGVTAATHFSWFGAYYQDPRRQFGLMPTDLSRFSDIYGEFEIDPDQFRDLQRNRMGLLVGEAMLDAFGWELGQRVPIGSTIFPQRDGSYAWEFDIVATFRGTGGGGDEMQAYGHFDYFNEGRAFYQDMVGWIVTRVEDPDNAEEIARQIDQRFANSPTETKTSTEEGWVAGFAAQFGNIGLIVQAILACVFFTLLLVAGNTMAQSVRERTGELAVMKTVGFTDRQVLGLVLGESLMLALLGAGLGMALGLLFLGGARTAVGQFLPGLALPPGALVTAAGLAVLLGLITGIVPAIRAMRLNIVTALARR
ncbi:FtsX-like permease family protein [Wenzhouxiangella sp. AB-CW3]|uniref:ABC transporter permease n=1 Tax=Wenzhouxiangella sp. AB-CW3 TaxID=2771012 RepID=UPI00168A629A|nr:FtsX-like permease family protein [Wenzhouxiangella sp. AB-CW3]QOC22398.1 FtsX-like permease family protein [Wenzhouxiangella sp. AB-CW3]